MDMEATLTSIFGSVPLREMVLSIGRSPNNGLFINHATVSRHHAEIRPQGQGYILVDLGSTSGTYVNGERLAPQTPHVLRAGDALQVGSIPLTYEERPARPLSAVEALFMSGASLGAGAQTGGGGAEQARTSGPFAPGEALAVSEIVSMSPVSDGLLAAAIYPVEASPVSASDEALSEKLPGLASSQVSAASAPSDDLERRQLHFTAFYQPVASVDTWHSLLVYAHIADALETVRADVQSRKELAVAAAEQSAGENEQIAGDEVRITVVPVFQGLEFQPERVSFPWTSEWHPVTLRYRADPRWAGATGTGEILLLAGPLVIASLRIPLRFVEAGEPLTEELAEVSVARYKNIFTSYSPADESLAKELHRAYEAFGDESLLDLEALRAGENWPALLPRAIESADVFQLFWSPNAAQSACIYQECQYALQHYKYDGFLRPVYWEKPLAFIPPELAHLPFVYYDLPTTPDK